MSDSGKIILPNVEKVMNLKGVLNIICSGCKTRESECQDFEPDLVISRFSSLMTRLPIQGAVFSPKRGGLECYVVLCKGEDKIETRKAHQDSRYQQWVGRFKKPEVGMLVVINDLLREITLFYQEALSPPLLIGDTWHDKEAAENYGVSFLDASLLHTSKDSPSLSWLRAHQQPPKAYTTL